MKALINFKKALKDKLESNMLINSVSQGDLSDVALDKQNIYPIAHYVINNGTINSSTSTFNVSILLLDIVDEKGSVDFFEHEDFVQNSMLSVATKVVQEFMRGDLYSEGYQVDDSATLEMFSERFEHKLAGVGLDFVVTLKNSIELC